MTHTSEGREPVLRRLSLSLFFSRAVIWLVMNLVYIFVMQVVEKLAGLGRFSQFPLFPWGYYRRNWEGMNHVSLQMIDENGRGVVTS